MSILSSRKRNVKTEQQAVAVAGQLEPVEPAYYKPVSPSPISSNMQVPSEPTEWQAPVVMRGQRRNGMRYLWALGGVRQPVSPLGTGPDVGVAVWSSEFQPDFVGIIHDAGFNDALFQAGYPGFNLGLSFKVQQLQQNATGGPGFNMRMNSNNIQVKIRKTGRIGSGASQNG